MLKTDNLTAMIRTDVAKDIRYFQITNYVLVEYFGVRNAENFFLFEGSNNLLLMFGGLNLC
jgi:hypothetical protein